MRQFRDIDRKDEIMALIKAAPASNLGEIWQTRPDTRNLYRILNVKDDLINKAIIIESSKKYEFSSKFPVYVRINNRDLIFKLAARSFVISGNKLACIYPNLAKAIDKRSTERFPLPPEREAHLVLKPLGAGAQELTVKLVDISRNGLGINISDMNRDYLLRNQKFRITSLNDMVLAQELQLDLKYVKRISKGNIKSGLKLITPFSDSTFEMICKIIFGT